MQLAQAPPGFPRQVLNHLAGYPKAVRTGDLHCSQASSSCVPSMWAKYPLCSWRFPKAIFYNLRRYLGRAGSSILHRHANKNMRKHSLCFYRSVGSSRLSPRNSALDREIYVLTKCYIFLRAAGEWQWGSTTTSCVKTKRCEEDDGRSMRVMLSERFNTKIERRIKCHIAPASTRIQQPL
jgi:hypothetical protein